MTEYSSKSLIDKLGVKPGVRCIIMRPPKDYLALLQELEERADVSTRLAGRFGFIQYFATSQQQLEAVMPNLASHLVPNGMLWMCWAKKASPLFTGVDENMVRRAGLAAGLVDVKVAAVTDDWSGLKFVYKVTDR